MAGFTVTRRGVADSRGSRASAFQLAGLARFVPAPTGDTTGVSDTANIHATRTVAGTNGTLLFQAGTYWVTGLSANVAGQNWQLPIGCTIKVANAVNAVVLTVNAAGVIIEGPGTIDGNSANNTGGSNFGVHFNVGATGSTLRRATIQNTYQTAVLIYPSGVTVQGNTILNTTIGAGIFAQPGTLNDLTDLHVFDNIVDKSSQNPATAQGYGIQLHGGPGGTTFTATTTSTSATLTGVSSFTGISNGLGLTGTGIPLGAVIQSFNAGAATITMSLPATASGSITVTVNYALRGIRVSRNEVKLPVNAVTTMIAIEVWGYCPGAVVEGNRTYGGYMGISMDRADNATVTANNVENYVANGVEVANCTNVTVSANTCDGSILGGDGVILDGLTVPSTKCTVTGNVVVRATSKSIYIISNGDHTSITGNALTTSTGQNCYGVYVQNSPRTSIVGNVMYCFSTASFSGVLLEGSASSGAVVVGNVFDSWPSAAVLVYAGTVQTVDQVVLGPNVIAGTTTIMGTLGSATMGNACRWVSTEWGQSSPGISSITPGASPYTYTNADHGPETIYISGGTVSAIAKNAVTLCTSAPAANAPPLAIPLEAGEAITVTYTVVPTMRKDRK